MFLNCAIQINVPFLAYSGPDRDFKGTCVQATRPEKTRPQKSQRHGYTCAVDAGIGNVECCSWSSLVCSE